MFNLNVIVARMEYHRTKDVLHVKKLLGHGNISNTLLYTQQVNFESFEYVTEMDGNKIFRKRK